MIKLGLLVVVLLFVGYSHSACHCGDKMAYFYSSQITPQGAQYYLYSYNLTTTEQVSIVKVGNGASLSTLYYATETKGRAIFLSTTWNGFPNQNTIVQFDLANQTYEVLGHCNPPTGSFEICSDNYDRHQNVGYDIVYNPATNEYGIYTLNYTTSSGSYVKKGYSTGCPYVSAPKDFSQFYLLINSTTAVVLSIGSESIATYNLVGFSQFINNASVIPIGGITEYRGSIYGTAYSPVNQTSTNIYIYKVDTNTLQFDVFFEYTENVVINSNFPTSMFSSDGSHAMLMVTVKGQQQALIYSFEISKSFLTAPKDAFPNSALSFYMVYDAPILPIYPEKSIIGVTFGYGIPIIFVLMGVVFLMYRNDFATLIEGAKGWDQAKVQKFTNIVFFFVGAIKLTVVYVLAEQLNTPGLALCATFMEIHKAMFGIFTSIFYKPKLLPIYYLLTALSIIFHFVTFITAFVHDPKVIVSDKGGVHFYKALTFLTFFFSTVYVIYFFIKVRKSDPTSSSNYKSDYNPRDEISYNPILNNDNYDDEE